MTVNTPQVGHLVTLPHSQFDGAFLIVRAYPFGTFVLQHLNSGNFYRVTGSPLMIRMERRTA